MTKNDLSRRALLSGLSGVAGSAWFAPAALGQGGCRDGLCADRQCPLPACRGTSHRAHQGSVRSHRLADHRFGVLHHRCGVDYKKGSGLCMPR